MYVASSTSAGQSGPSPVQNSAGSQGVDEARHSVPASAKTSSGQSTAIPSQNSATSQSPAAARHSVPEATDSSAGQIGPSPGQNSAASHAPAAGRHTQAAWAKPSVGQAAATPSQYSATSQSPAAARHSVPASFSPMSAHVPSPSHVSCRAHGLRQIAAGPCPPGAATNDPPRPVDHTRRNRCPGLGVAGIVHNTCDQTHIREDIDIAREGTYRDRDNRLSRSRIRQLRGQRRMGGRMVRQEIHNGCSDTDRLKRQCSNDIVCHHGRAQNLSGIGDVPIDIRLADFHPSFRRRRQAKLSRLNTNKSEEIAIIVDQCLHAVDGDRQIGNGRAERQSVRRSVAPRAHRTHPDGSSDSSRIPEVPGRRRPRATGQPRLRRHRSRCRNRCRCQRMQSRHRRAHPR